MVTPDAHTRRQILKAAIGGAAGLVLGAPVRSLAAAAQTAVAVTSTGQLSDDLFLLRLPGEANVLAQTGSGGVLLVDGGSAKAADALTAHVSGLPGGGPVHTIFNTHWHPEQTGSNERLGKAGATIIAQENTRLWLTTDVTWPWNGQRFKRLPKIAQPNKTFYTTGTLESGIRYGYIPDAAHTDGDLYVYFPKQNVLAVGDVVSGEGWPVVDWQTGGWIGGIVGGLQRLQTIANAETRIVPGRGPVLSLADVKKQTEMYGDDLQPPVADAEQRQRADRGRGSKADERVRCRHGQRRRVRAPLIREPLGILIARRVDDADSNTSNGCARFRCCRAHGHVDRRAHGLSVIACSAARARCCAVIHCSAVARRAARDHHAVLCRLSQRSREDRRRQFRGRDRGQHRPARRSVREGRAQAARTRDAAPRRSTAAERRD